MVPSNETSAWPPDSACSSGFSPRTSPGCAPHIPHTWETFFTNSDVLQAFGASNDRTTSEYLSWLTGAATIFVESENESRGVSRGKMYSRQRGSGQAVSEKGRRLLTPDEVRRLDRDLQLVFVRGCDPLLARRVNYLDDPAFRGQFDANPQYERVAT
ncbi:MAG: type IV secretory system conjugative DNA transfer family protein [Longimicrobiales bacterium]